MRTRTKVLLALMGAAGASGVVAAAAPRAMKALNQRALRSAVADLTAALKPVGYEAEQDGALIDHDGQGHLCHGATLTISWNELTFWVILYARKAQVYRLCSPSTPVEVTDLMAHRGPLPIPQAPRGAKRVEITVG